MYLFVVVKLFMPMEREGGERRWRAVVQCQLGSQSKHANGREEVQKVKIKVSFDPFCSYKIVS